MSRSVQLTESATWWPSVLWQTTTLELVRGRERLLVDPGIAPWEVREAAGDGASTILITHADWDHVMGIGLLPQARVHASAASARRIASGEAFASIEREAGAFALPLERLDSMRVDQLLPEDGSETLLGSFTAICHAALGHTDDGIVTWLPEERLLIAGDHLSQLELPLIQDSAWHYRSTLQMLTGLIERERPDLVIVGHGRPQPPDDALRIAEQDAVYVGAVIAFAEAGGDPERFADVPHPERADSAEHAGNIQRASLAVAGG